MLVTIVTIGFDRGSRGAVVTLVTIVTIGALHGVSESSILRFLLMFATERDREGRNGHYGH
jgi:hypothetical protein